MLAEIDWSKTAGLIAAILGSLATVGMLVWTVTASVVDRFRKGKVELREGGIKGEYYLVVANNTTADATIDSAYLRRSEGQFRFKLSWYNGKVVKAGGQEVLRFDPLVAIAGATGNSALALECDIVGVRLSSGKEWEDKSGAVRRALGKVMPSVGGKG